MISLLAIKQSGERNTRIDYVYSCWGIAKKFFSRKRFFVEYEGVFPDAVPTSILVIPFLVNVLPVAWFTGFDVAVDELDEEFYQAVQAMRELFLQRGDVNKSAAGELLVRKLVKNEQTGEEAALLFSGGVDSTFSFIQHNGEIQNLVTIHGADIRIKDELSFKGLQEEISSSSVYAHLIKHRITSNLRTFLTPRINLLLDDFDWWGRVQHGWGMLGLLAPLSFVHGIKRIYIASSNTGDLKIDWGSSPGADELLKWNGLRINHDGYNVSRFEKTKTIVEFAQRSNKLRIKVCYNETQGKLNCGVCEKCLRTALSIVISGGDPNNFGLKADAGMYDLILKRLSRGFHSQFVRYFWIDIARNIDNQTHTFVFENEALEKEKLLKIRELVQSSHSGRVYRRGPVWRLRLRIQLLLPGLHRYFKALLR